MIDLISASTVILYVLFCCNISLFPIFAYFIPLPPIVWLRPRHHTHQPQPLCRAATQPTTAPIKLPSGCWYMENPFDLVDWFGGDFLFRSSFLIHILVHPNFFSYEPVLHTYLRIVHLEIQRCSGIYYSSVITKWNKVMSKLWDSGFVNPEYWTTGWSSRVPDSHMAWRITAKGCSQALIRWVDLLFIAVVVFLVPLRTNQD